MDALLPFRKMICNIRAALFDTRPRFEAQVGTLVPGDAADEIELLLCYE